MGSRPSIRGSGSRQVRVIRIENLVGSPAPIGTVCSVNLTRNKPMRPFPARMAPEIALGGVSDGAGGWVLLPEPEVPGVLGRVGGDLVEVFDVGQAAFRVAVYLVFQFLVGQDLPEGSVVDAVGDVLADLGQGRFPAEPAPVVGFQFRVGGWTLGAHAGNLQPCSSWRHSGLRFGD